MHRATTDNNGDTVDIINADALCVPDMDICILSVTAWGHQHTKERKDECCDMTHCITHADQGFTEPHFNRMLNKITIHNVNDLPHMRCGLPIHSKANFLSFSTCFDCLSAVTQPDRTVEKHQL